jgi:hypothetical protein
MWWTASWFLADARDYSLLHSVETDSGAHPASYKVGTVDFFPGVQSVKLTTHLHLVPRLRIEELYLHSPICLHGIVLN